MARFDGNWDEWRRRFVSGGDEATLKWLSEQPGAPSYSSLRKRSAPKCEDWEEQRRNYREQLRTLASASPEVRQTAEMVAKIIDTAEMLTQHNTIAKVLLSKGIDGLKALNAATMKPSEIAAFIKLGIDTQRITEGLATQRTELDFKTMSDAELESLVDNGQ